MKEWITDNIRNVRIFFRSNYEKACRMVFWGWHMRNSYDFDAHTIYDMLYLKLDRIHICMKHHNHCLWNATENTNMMRKLRETKELCKREANATEEYEMRAWYETEAKFGKIIHEHIKDTPVGSSYRLRWKNDKVARKYWKQREEHWEQVHKQNRDRLFKLLDHYLEQWWD